MRGTQFSTKHHLKRQKKSCYESYDSINNFYY